MERASVSKCGYRLLLVPMVHGPVRRMISFQAGCLRANERSAFAIAAFASATLMARLAFYATTSARALRPTALTMYCTVWV
jgi:hypothetical protein